MTTIIIGAGIAGLAASISLKLHGFDSLIYERHSSSGEGGYGFILLENGLAAIDALGLSNDIKSNGVHIDQFILKDESGNSIFTHALSNAICIKRSDLVKALRSRISPSAIHFNHLFSHFTWDEIGNVKEACFENAKAVPGQLFIGADGAFSKVRSVIEPSFKAPDVVVKEIVSHVHFPPAVEKHLLKFQHSKGGLAAGCIPCGDDTVIWYLQFDAKKYNLHSKQPEYKKQFIRELIGKWPEPLPSLIANTDFSESYVWNTFNMDLLPKPHGKNIVLIGDAAHTFSPFTSQGVNTSLQDALTLSQVLSTSKGLEDCMKKYSELRFHEIDNYVKAGNKLIKHFLSAEIQKGYLIPLVN